MASCARRIALILTTALLLAPADAAVQLGVEPRVAIASVPNESAAAGCLSPVFMTDDSNDEEWNQTGNPPSVRIRLQMDNVCERAIACTTAFSAGSVDGATDNAGTWKPYATDVRTVALASAQRVALDVLLPWKPSPGRVGKVLRFAAHARNLARCHFTEPGVAGTTLVLPGELGYDEALPALMLSAKSAFRALRGAADVSLEDGTHFYVARLTITGMTNCEIQVTPDQSASYSCDAASVPDAATAMAMYQRWQSRLTAGAKKLGLTVNEKIDSPQRRRTQTEYVEHAPSADVWLDAGVSRWTIRISVYS